MSEQLGQDVNVLRQAGRQTDGETADLSVRTVKAGQRCTETDRQTDRQHF